MSRNKILLEIPVFSPGAALEAAVLGADRLELCSSYIEGGLTPGPGLFLYLKKKIEIPIFVMIRPREGDFAYSDAEIEVMQEEIDNFLELGADGFVFGVLNSDGTVHKKACKILVDRAKEKPCTFHRAFDVSSDLMKSLEDVIDCGFKRILTSGGKNSVGEGLPVIQKLLTEAKDQIIIMPGGGMKPEFVDPLRKIGYLKEIHASCKKIKKSKKSEVKISIEGVNSVTISKKNVDDFIPLLRGTRDE